MRIDVEKYIFLGISSQRAEFFQKLQQLGIVQCAHSKVSFVDLLFTDFHEVVQAIKILKENEVQQTPHVEITHPLEFSKTVIAEKTRLADARLELRALQEQQKLLFPFGPIPIKEMLELEQILGRKFRLFAAPSRAQAEKNFEHLILLKEIEKIQYFISFSKEPFLPTNIEEIFLSPELSTLETEIDLRNQEIAHLEEQLRFKASLITSLKQALINDLNTAKWQKAAQTASSNMDDRLFSITGWVPSTKRTDVEALVDSLGMYCMQIPIRSSETPPTYLENNETGKIGEDLIDIYDTPSCEDTDPSSWVLFFFALFFAMIISDGGYGLIFLLSALLMRKKAKNASTGQQRFVKLLAILGGFCVAWGLLVGSFFSIDFRPNHPLKSYSLITYLTTKQAEYRISHQDESYTLWIEKHHGTIPTVQQFLFEPNSPHQKSNYELFADGILIELALLVGTIHIMISLCRYIRRNIGNIGWLIAIIGSYLYIPYYLDACSIIYYILKLPPEQAANIGLQLLGFGSIFAIGTAIVKNGFTGIFELMTGIQIFTDILSYLRIYALGLAGAIFAATINTMSDKFPFIIALILIVVSHLLNIVLSVVGGVIHGLRLNFLEWYHYSFDGGGKKFTPLNVEKL